MSVHLKSGLSLVFTNAYKILLCCAARIILQLNRVEFLTLNCVFSKASRKRLTGPSSSSFLMSTKGMSGIMKLILRENISFDKISSKYLESLTFASGLCFAHAIARHNTGDLS